MKQTVATSVEIISSGRALGADIEGIDLRSDLDKETFSQIVEAWMNHLVLRFRGQHELPLAKLVEFSRMFGDLDQAPISAKNGGKPYIPEHPEITVISNIERDGRPIGGLGAYEAVWHADMTYNDKPPAASLLYAIEIPPAGGDTHFANMYQAYDTLPNDLAQCVDELSCVHDASHNSAGELRPGFKEVTDPTQTVGAVHPLARVHPDTGRKALFLGRRRNAYVKGLDFRESEALLDRLWAHATKPEFTWFQEWKVGDLIIWDNRCTLHRRDGFNPKDRRLLYRTQVRRVRVN